MIRGAGDAVEFVGGAFGGEVVVGPLGPDCEGTLHFEQSRLMLFGTGEVFGFEGIVFEVVEFELGAG